MLDVRIESELPTLNVQRRTSNGKARSVLPPARLAGAVFEGDAEAGETVADGVSEGKVLGGPGVLAELDQQLHHGVERRRGAAGFHGGGLVAEQAEHLAEPAERLHRGAGGGDG